MNVDRPLCKTESAPEGHSAGAKTRETAGCVDEAEDLFKKSLEADPTSVPLTLDLGDFFLRHGRLDEAELVYRYALSLDHRSCAVLNNLGNTMKQKGDHAEAERFYREALTVNPHLLETLTNLGILFLNQKRFDEAETYLRRATALNPRFGYAARELGNLSMEQGRYTEAEALYRYVLSVNPGDHDAAFNLSYVLLLHGKYEEGWDRYELRLKRADFQYLCVDGKRRFDPSSASQTVLVRAEQGLGDTIQFVRFLSELKGNGRRIIFECQPQLVDLLGSVQGVDTIVPRTVGLKAPDIAFDEYIPLLSLPGVFKITAETIPAHVPYVAVDQGLIEKWKMALGSEAGRERFKVGVAWAGNPKNTGDKFRSLTLKSLTPLFGVDGAIFYSLQYGIAVAEIEALPTFANLVDFSRDLKAFADTAAFIMNLDLVITVDSVIAHLAGALGKPCWNLIPYVPDWRWLIDRSDSPWYPTMRLIRQKSLNDWEETLQEVTSELAHIVLRNRPVTSFATSERPNTPKEQSPLFHTPQHSPSFYPDMPVQA